VLTRPAAKASDEPVYGVSTFSNKISWRFGLYTQVCESFDTVEGILGLGCIIPLRGWRK